MSFSLAATAIVLMVGNKVIRLEINADFQDNG